MPPDELVRVSFTLGPDAPADAEGIWARPTDRGTYIVDNIPFYARDVALGDEVGVDREGGRLWSRGVLAPSGAMTLRFVVLAEDEYRALRDMRWLAARLDALGIDHEDDEDRLMVAAVQETHDLDALLVAVRYFRASGKGRVELGSLAPWWPADD